MERERERQPEKRQSGRQIKRESKTERRKDRNNETDSWTEGVAEKEGKRKERGEGEYPKEQGFAPQHVDRCMQSCALTVRPHHLSE